MPAAEFDVTDSVVRSLLVAQHPDLADRPLTLIANGWDNVIYRLGGDLVARLPRREMAAALVTNEQRWLPGLADRLPIAIPAPVRHGTATDEYPWAWSICPWFDGVVAADVALTAPELEARRLGEFLDALHAAEPPGAPPNPYRGHPVRELRSRFARRVEQIADRVDASVVLAKWDELVDVEEWTGPPLWIHGDLHTANVLVDHGAIRAVIDWGDITAGDPACDFAIAWMLFDATGRQHLRAAAGRHVAVDDATWQRAQAWALHFAVMYLLHSADNPRFERMGTELLSAILGEARS